MNGAACENTAAGQHCNCTAGFKGRYCETGTLTSISSQTRGNPFLCVSNTTILIGSWL